MYENPWFYTGVVFESEYIHNHVGFVYCITNLSNGRKYIGKKFFWTMKTRQVKKKKKRVKIESDWKDYYGSSDELCTDIEKYGKITFRREIIRLCLTKSECSYYEAKEQFDRDAIISEDYYNNWIMVRVRKSNIMSKNNKLL